MKGKLKYYLLFSLVLAIGTSIKSQKKYQSLLWEITGNGIEKPSYLYGTMHVSNKKAFYLGTPFFDALESVDRVALELEPELWFDEVLGGRFSDAGSTAYNRNYGNNSWNQYVGSYKCNLDFEKTIQDTYKQGLGVMNQLLFRFYDLNGNFEENTWLDMYIYQTAKKLGKETYGLETFDESTEMMKKSQEATQKDDYNRNSIDRKERIELGDQLEGAYRDGNLDLLDSITKRISEPAFLKYILVERNKNFIKGLDTLLRQKPIFAGMGAAHLPGEEGCIEMLRELGYTVKPVTMGKRDAKKKKKLDGLILKSPLKKYTTNDEVISFESPYNVYPLPSYGSSSGIITMDIANGLTFSLNRFMSHNGLLNLSAKDIMFKMDSIMYETIPGDILSKKKIDFNGFPGFDILNKTRRGDIHRSVMIFMPTEVVIARLEGTGQNIQNGAGSYFFSTLNVKYPSSRNVTDWSYRAVADSSFKFEAPGNLTTYSIKENKMPSPTMFIEITDQEGDVFLVYRKRDREFGYLDEDGYLKNAIAEAFGEDFAIEIESMKEESIDSKEALRVSYSTYNGKKSECLILQHGLGQYVFSAFSNNNEKVNRFFESISVRNPVQDSLFEYVDSTLFFESKVPWEANNKDLSNLFGYYGGLFNEKNKQKASDNYNRTTTLYSPNSTEEIEVIYRRNGKYFFDEDKEALIEDIEYDLTAASDLIIDNKKIEWKKDGFISDYWLSDTLCSRKYRIRKIMNDHHSHTIQATYDASSGESDFILKFIENFQPISDSLSVGSYFYPTDSIYYADIMSSDTLLFNEAIEKLYVLGYFNDDTKYALAKKIFENTPPLASDKDKEAILSYYNNLLYLNASSDNVQALKDSFNIYTDSASYQMQILGNLMAMQTKESVLTAKKLLLDEAPIGIDVSPYFGVIGLITDSLELGKIMFPEILELTSYQEYKYPIIKVLASMVDSGAIDKEVYKSYLSYFVREAKVEFRRLKSQSRNQNKYDYLYEDYQITDNSTIDYWSILYPFKNVKSVQEIYALAETSNKKHIIKAYAEFKHRKGIKVSDKECKDLMEKDKDIENFYMLRNLDRKDLIPDSLDLVKEFVEEVVLQKTNNYRYNQNEDKEKDSIVFLRKFDDSIRTRKYTTFYYKKHETTYNDKKKWKAVVVMVLKNKSGEPEFSTLRKDESLNEEKEEEKQFGDLRKKLIAKNRNNNYRNDYISDYQYGDYDSDLFEGLDWR